MADMSTISADLLEIKNSIKALAKILRKLKTSQDDPDGEKAKARANNNGFNRPLEISEKLRTFLELGEGELICRSEVTRRINAYVTANGLKHPDNGRVIILDDKLKTLLEPPEGLEITFLNVQRYLSPHYVKVPKEPKAPKAPKEPKEKPAPVVVPTTPTAGDETPKVKRPVVKKAVAKA
jgi:upstream activation factor subunit UAF30